MGAEMVLAVVVGLAITFTNLQGYKQGIADAEAKAKAQAEVTAPEAAAAEKTDTSKR